MKTQRPAPSRVPGGRPPPTHRPALIAHRDADDLARAVAERLVAELRGLPHPTHIAATGGGLGQAIWPALVAQPGAEDVDWAGVHVWFSDERFVPGGDPQRNDCAALAVAGRLGLPLANIHRAPGSDAVATVADAARAYADELAAWTDSARPGLAAPWIAISLLGLGPDGHVASLFPGRSAPSEGTVTVVTDSPKPPPERVSFTRAMLQRCDRLWFLSAGEAKADAMRRALAGDDPDRTPAAGLRGAVGTVWFIDEALRRAIRESTGAPQTPQVR